MKDNISRSLLHHFEESTARVNAAEARRVRKSHWRRVIIGAVLVVVFLGATYGACMVHL